MADVTLANITKTYGDTTALADVSLTIPDGAFVAPPARARPPPCAWSRV